MGLIECDGFIEKNGYVDFEVDGILLCDCVWFDCIFDV